MTENAAAPASSPANSETPRILPLLLILFIGSGCSALIYEIVWYQLLQSVIGSTAVSLGILLATFMGGLCLGSLALPQILAVRRRHPLRVYAAIEMGIGLCGGLVLSGMPLVSRVYIATLGHGLPSILLRATICAICLLAPTMLMGASLPAIARWVEASPRRSSWLGLFYAGNTMGAVLGCLWAGFYLLRVFDITIATYVAAAINATVAAVSFGLAMFLPMPPETAGPRKVREPDHSGVRGVYAAIALSGACALGAEVVWTRLLGLMLGATVYTFSIILAVFLVGLALGSGAGSLLSMVVPPRVAIGFCQLLLTVAIAWTAFALAGRVPHWAVSAKAAADPWLLFRFDLKRVLWALWPATLLWGASFPLALAAVSPEEDDAARVVGNVYAANTGGAIVGALAFSIVLISLIGTRQAERALIGLSCVSALCALAPMVWSRRSKIGAGIGVRVGASGLAVAILAAGFLAAKVPAVPAMVIAYGRENLIAGETKILYVGEGRNSSIAVSQYGESFQFHVSGKVEASSNPYDMRVQRMLGDMPALLHAMPRTVLVVGFGAGVTAGSFVVNPDVRRIVVCEIEPLVPPITSHYFNKQNYDVLHDKRTEVVFDDARNYLLTTPEKFDVITSDPIHPWVRGSATLYTQEYFEMAKAHLNPGGIVAQWVPLYETDSDTVKSEIATFFDVFPNGTIWANEVDDGGYDVMLLGQVDPIRINIDQLQQRLDRPGYAGVAQSLRDVGLNSAADILGTYAGQASDLKRWLKGAQINRDRNLRLQYLAGLAVDTSQEGTIYNEILRYRRFPVDLIVGSDPVIEAFRRQASWKK